MGGNWPGDVETNLAGTEFAIDYVYYAQMKNKKLQQKNITMLHQKLVG